MTTMAESKTLVLLTQEFEDNPDSITKWKRQNIEPATEVVSYSMKSRSIPYVNVQRLYAKTASDSGE